MKTKWGVIFSYASGKFNFMVGPFDDKEEALAFSFSITSTSELESGITSYVPKAEWIRRARSHDLHAV